MDKPTIADHLTHCGRHARRFKNLSWEDTATLSSYVSSLENQLATARAEALREAAERAVDWLNKDHFFDPPEPFDELRAAILDNKQEEK
jgi:hypothetical protein